MRALSLCQSCKRHIRVSERTCPFCGAAHVLAAAAQELRPRGRPGGRAALFLAGAAAAPGCADEPDVPEQAIPVYGAAIDYDASRVDGGAASDAGKDARSEMSIPPYGISPVYGVPVDRDAGKDANVCGDPQEPMAVPVYGIPVVGKPARDAGSDASVCGADGGVKDAGPMLLPPYGIPVDPRLDASTRDAGKDAATRDAEIMVVPVYGISLVIEPREE
jgi:hypothetical protein